MQTIEYRVIDKSTWGDGPWQAELDKQQWPDPATGLACIIRRAHHGALCGYVGVPPDHPLYGKNYHDVHLEAHGSVNFAAACDPDEPEETGICHLPDPNEPDHVWWFGFDCAHSSDYAPAMEAQMRDVLPPELQEGAGQLFRRRYQTYRPWDYVKEEVTSLAAQLHAAALTTKDQPA